MDRMDVQRRRNGAAISQGRGLMPGKTKTVRLFAMSALCAALFGAGIGMTSAQVVDQRCQQCDWDHYACIVACDYEGGETDCYRACNTQRRLCKETFCP
jgi:hypothetical protein